MQSNIQNQIDLIGNVMYKEQTQLVRGSINLQNQRIVTSIRCIVS